VCSRHMGQPNQARKARQVTYDPRKIVFTHPAYLSIEMGYRAGDALKSTHLRPPAATGHNCPKTLGHFFDARCAPIARRLGSPALTPHAAGSTPAGFSFAFVGRGDPLMLLPFKAMLFGRAGKSGRPPPLEPSLKVQRDIAHNQSSGFAVAAGSKVSTRAGL
jgi:hypothetical protein